VQMKRHSIPTWVLVVHKTFASVPPVQCIMGIGVVCCTMARGEDACTHQIRVDRIVDTSTFVRAFCLRARRFCTGERRTVQLTVKTISVGTAVRVNIARGCCLVQSRAMIA
jgi:hypothetical protein